MATSFADRALQAVRDIVAFLVDDQEDAVEFSAELTRRVDMHLLTSVVEWDEASGRIVIHAPDPDDAPDVVEGGGGGEREEGDDEGAPTDDEIQRLTTITSLEQKLRLSRHISMVYTSAIRYLSKDFMRRTFAQQISEVIAVLAVRQVLVADESNTLNERHRPLWVHCTSKLELFTTPPTTPPR